MPRGKPGSARVKSQAGSIGADDNAFSYRFRSLDGDAESTLRVQCNNCGMGQRHFFVRLEDINPILDAFARAHTPVCPVNKRKGTAN